MKAIFLLFFIFFVFMANAKNIYVSATGNDNNSGLTPTTAWQTISKINISFSGITAGDSILFKSGDIFYGNLIVSKSGTTGKSIVIGAYGVGAKPIITGLTAATGWTNVGANLWESASISNADKPNMVTFNGNCVAIGRYPNSGYLTFENSVANSSITDNELTGSPNFTGAEIVIRKRHFYLSRDIITNHSGTTLSYSGGSGVNSINGYGYFIQNSLSTLDSQNEWYFNPVTKKITVYSSVIPTNIKVSSMNNLLYTGQNDFLTVENISFEGANVAAICVGNLANTAIGILIKNCTINNSGRDAVYFTNSTNSIVENCTINNSYNNAILFENHGGWSDGNIVRLNKITNTGINPGMSFNGTSNQAITIYGENSTIEYNKIDNTGYNAIVFYKNNAKVNNNVINTFCTVKDDGAGIYTFTGNTGIKYSGREVKNNIILNGAGAGAGTLDGISSAQGIYTDDGSTGIEIKGNSIANMSFSGIYIHNSQDIAISNNTIFNSQNTQMLIMHDNYVPNSPIRNVNINKNILYSKKVEQNMLTINTIKNDLDIMGKRDSNYYALPIEDNAVFQTSKYVNGLQVFNSYFSLESWKSNYPTQDIHSKKSYPYLPPYTIDKIIGNNLVVNNQFSVNINNTTAWSSNNTHTFSWDNSSKITGTGSAKIASTSTSGYTLILIPVGVISNSKTYLLRFSTLGTQKNSSIKAYLRSTVSPYGKLAPIQVKNLATSRIDHEIVFTSPISDPNANITFEIQQSEGTVYLDNVDFYEANITPNSVDNNLRFEYNSTNSAQTIILDAKYIGVDSTVYNGSITLQPFSSVILLKSGLITTSLKADAGTDISLIMPINSTVLKGSATGTVTTYSWKKIAGPDQFSIATPTSARTVINNLAMGKYTFELKVTNSAGEFSTATVNVVALGVLPVTLIDFTATKKEGDVQMQWNVLSELNLSHYSVQRSINGEEFESIGNVVATNLFITQRYHYSDKFSLKGTSYYRLAMVDIDGTTKFSRVVSVTDNESSSFQVNTVVLSHTNNTMKIAVQSNYEQVMQVVIADVSGRIIYSNPIKLQKGFNEINRKMPALNTGVYYAKMFTTDVVITKAFLSQH